MQILPKSINTYVKLFAPNATSNVTNLFNPSRSYMKLMEVHYHEWLSNVQKTTACVIEVNTMMGDITQRFFEGNLKLCV